MKLNLFKKNTVGKIRSVVVAFLPALLVIVVVALPSFILAQGSTDLPPAPVNAQRTLSSELDPNLNPNSSAFKIVVCDGPTLPPALLIEENAKRDESQSLYVACDFNGMMLLVQHLINIMMVIGVLVAIVMFSFAGYLYITGKEANITKATSIFPKVLWGFIIMLSAWFIVYQILSWLTKEGSGFSTLLGKP